MACSGALSATRAGGRALATQGLAGEQRPLPLLSRCPPLRSLAPSQRLAQPLPHLHPSSSLPHTPALQQPGPRGRHVTPHASGAGAVPLGGGGGTDAFGNPTGRPAGKAGFLEAFWKFLRPHTIRGTLLGTTAVVSRALIENPALIDWGLLPKALMGLLALLCGNGYIVGINQIYDVDIDVVNKPFLPVAAGELSPSTAWVLVASLAALGVGIVARNFGPLITTLYTFGLFLGTVYSIPPLRLKRFAIPAFMIIATVRGFLLNFGVYYATRAALGQPFSWSPAISFITCFVTMFATVIAITKDLPDVEGDKAHGISTFATRMGVSTVSLLAVGMLMTNYVFAVYLGLTQPSFNTPLMVGAHSVLACVLAFRAWRLHLAKYSKDAILSFYRWVWNLFYTEYALLPFV